MFPDGGGYWRHEGWGQPSALNSVVHLVYAQHGTGSDPGDVYYIRSTDRGKTFGAPFKLNTDATTRPQWQPNLSVAVDGTVFTTGKTLARAQAAPVAIQPHRVTECGRESRSIMALPGWLDDIFSDVITPLPAQSLIQVLCPPM